MSATKRQIKQVREKEKQIDLHGKVIRRLAELLDGIIIDPVKGVVLTPKKKRQRAELEKTVQKHFRKGQSGRKQSPKKVRSTKEEVKRLQKRRDKLWEDFCRLPKKDSFSGLRISGELNAVQQKLDKLEGNKRSKRHYTEINIEVF